MFNCMLTLTHAMEHVTHVTYPIILSIFLQATDTCGGCSNFLSWQHNNIYHFSITGEEPGKLGIK